MIVGYDAGGGLPLSTIVLGYTDEGTLLAASNTSSRITLIDDTLGND